MGMTDIPIRSSVAVPRSAREESDGPQRDSNVPKPSFVSSSVAPQSTTYRAGLSAPAGRTGNCCSQIVFGYLIVRTLIPLIHALGRLGHSRGFAATSNATRRPFHMINYLGSCGGGQIFATHAMAALLDRTI